VRRSIGWGFLGKEGHEGEQRKPPASAEARRRKLEQELGIEMTTLHISETTRHAIDIADKIASFYPPDVPEKVHLAQELCAGIVFPDRKFSREATSWAMSLSKLGYLARIVEEDDFNADPRVPVIAGTLERVSTDPDWQRHGWWGAVNIFPGTMATATDDPIQDTWGIPGLGGDLRREVLRWVLRAMLEDSSPPSDLSASECACCFVFGFLFRCGEMSLPAAAGRLRYVRDQAPISDRPTMMAPLAATSAITSSPRVSGSISPGATRPSFSMSGRRVTATSVVKWT
jgi:hypothetical protein